MRSEKETKETAFSQLNLNQTSCKVFSDLAQLFFGYTWEIVGICLLLTHTNYLAFTLDFKQSY